jgi:hypothetical protein
VRGGPGFFLRRPRPVTTPRPRLLRGRRTRPGPRGPAARGPADERRPRRSGARARSANRVLARPPPPRRGWRREEEEEHSPSSSQRAGGGGGGTGVTNSDLSLTKTITNPLPRDPGGALGPAPPPRSRRGVPAAARAPRARGPGLPPSADARPPRALPSAPGAARRRHGTCSEAALAPTPEVSGKEGSGRAGPRPRGGPARPWRRRR